MYFFYNNRVGRVVSLMPTSFALLVTLHSANVFAQDQAIGVGHTVFKKHCAACHAPGLNHPGTIQLTKTRGEANGVLEERNNLPPAYVKNIVRAGLNGMPGFKPSTITEAQLESLAEYLAPK
jgi:mono/diheme cytochrome c family protein